MTNIVVLCHDRYRLTVQCIDSIRKNTYPESYNLTLVDDGSQDFRVRNYLRDQAVYHPKNTTLIEVMNSKHCLGALKNLGIRHSELTFGRSEWLCVLDNDVYVFPDWLIRMEDDGRDDSSPNTFGVLLSGGCRHPFHQPIPPISEDRNFEKTDAVAGYCHFMAWWVWDRFGPYDSNAPGIGQSEDYVFSRKIVEAGRVVGYEYPPVMAHCGITNSNGEPIAGAELIERVPGVLYL